MKELYICEKCGKTFDRSTDAYDCEISHRSPDSICFLVPPVFAPGSSRPSEVTVCFDEYHYDSVAGAGIYRHTYATYKLKKVFSEAENAEVERLRLLDEERQAREFDEWKARHEAAELAAGEPEKETLVMEEEKVGA